MAAVFCAQDVLYDRSILISLELELKFPMLLEIDNKGTSDLINNWSVVGRTRDVGISQLFLHEMKQKGVFQVV